MPSLRLIITQRLVLDIVPQQKPHCSLVDLIYGLRDGCPYFEGDFFEFMFDTANPSSNFPSDDSRHHAGRHLVVLFDCIEGRQHLLESAVTVQVQSVNWLKFRLGKYLLPSLLSVHIA